MSDEQHDGEAIEEATEAAATTERESELMDDGSFHFVLRNLSSVDEAGQTLQELVRDESITRWQMGDLLNHVAITWPADPQEKEKGATIKEVCKIARVSYSSGKELARVCRAVEPGIRASFPRLAFTHWRTMVRLGIEGPGLVEWARKADDGEWTAEGLAAEIDKGVNRPDDEDGSAGKKAWKKCREWLESAAAGVGDLKPDLLIEAIQRQPEDVTAEIERIESGLTKWREAMAEVRRLVEQEEGFCPECGTVYENDDGDSCEHCGAVREHAVVEGDDAPEREAGAVDPGDLGEDEAAAG